MTARIIDGRNVAAALLETVTRETAQFTQIHGRRPCLATVLVGDDPSSHTYVRMKRNRCAEVGMESRYVELPEETTTTTAALVAEIAALSADPTVDGILLQHPVQLISTSAPRSRRSHQRRTSTASPCTASQQWLSTREVSIPARRAGSFVFLTPTRFPWLDSTRSSSGAARSSESLLGCCSSLETRPSPTATHVLETSPNTFEKPTLSSLPSVDPNLSVVSGSRTVRWSSTQAITPATSGTSIMPAQLSELDSSHQCPAAWGR